MIPVFQTRYAVETFGNCFEACLASILELPLAAIPDRAALVDADAWADRVNQAHIAGGDQAVGDLDLPAEYEAGEEALRQWLEERGLAWFDILIGSAAEKVVPERVWLDVASKVFARGYWIGHTRTAPRATSHATVWRGASVVHNPSRGWPADKDLGPLHAATLLVAADPAKIARLQPLPDVAGVLDRAINAELATAVAA